MSRFAALVMLSALASLAPAQQPAHLSFQSPDAVIAEVRRVAQVTGRDDLVKQIDGALLLSGPRDVGGVDRKKPFGLYLAPLDRAGASVVAFLPIADEKKFLITLV